jgi:hypothetical protein
MRTADRISAILLLLGSVFMLFETEHVRTTAYQILSNKLFPHIIFGLVIALALLLLVSTFLSRATSTLPAGYWRRAVGGRRVITLGLICLYVLVMPVIGFLPASAGFVVVTTGAISPKPRRDIPIAFAVAAGVAGLIYLIFVYWLQVFLP